MGPGTAGIVLENATKPDMDTRVARAEREWQVNKKDLFSVVVWEDLLALGDLIVAGADLDGRTADQSTVLHVAAQGGNSAIADCLIMAGAVIDARNRVNRTPLHLAAAAGHTSFAECLLINGANLNAQDSNQVTALHLAAERGHIGVVRLLMSRGALYQLLDCQNQLPIHRAAANGHAAAISELNAAGLNAVDKKGFTPLALAIRNGHLTTANALVPLSTVQFDIPNLEGDTCLHHAARIGEPELFLKMVDEGADVTITNKKGQRPLEIRCCAGDTLLLVAARKGNLGSLFRLIELGADLSLANIHGHSLLNIQNQADETLLHVVARAGKEKMFFDLMLVGMDVNAFNQTECTPRDMLLLGHPGQTLLHRAAYQGHEAAVAYLLKQSEDVKSKDTEGNTALHLVLKLPKSGLQTRIVQLLIEYGADLFVSNVAHLTPWDMAIQQNMGEVVTVFLGSMCPEDRATILKIKSDGDTLLHYALHHRAGEVVKVLIQAGVNIEELDNDGNSPLHIAINEKDVLCANLLIIGNANPRVKDKDGYTCLHKAVLTDNYALLHVICSSRDDGLIHMLDKKGNSALHLAMGVRQDSAVIVLLLLKGARWDIENELGETPMELANDFAIAELLLGEKKVEELKLMLSSLKKEQSKAISVVTAQLLRNYILQRQANPKGEYFTLFSYFLKRVCSRHNKIAVAAACGEAIEDNFGRSLVVLNARQVGAHLQGVSLSEAEIETVMMDGNLFMIIKSYNEAITPALTAPVGERIAFARLSQHR